MEGFQRPDPVLSTWDPWVNTLSKGPCLLELTFYQRDRQYIKSVIQCWKIIIMVEGREARRGGVWIWAWGQITF